MKRLKICKETLLDFSPLSYEFMGNKRLGILFQGEGELVRGRESEDRSGSVENL